MKRFLRGFFLQDWLLKVASLLIALILWLFVRGNPEQERVVAVQLEIRKPQQMEIISQIPSSVEVTMRGTSVSNAWFSQLPPTCVLDLQSASEGEHVVALTKSNIRMSQRGGIEILHINPMRLTITLEAMDSKEVPIAIPISAAPPNGMELYDKYSLPSTVIITGAKSRVAPITKVETMPISLAEQRESGRFFVNLNLPDYSIRASVVNLIQVQADIGPVRSKHTIDKIPVSIEVAGEYSFTPEHVSVQILAPPDYIKNVSAGDFRAVVSSGTFDANHHPTRAPLAIQMPKGSNSAVKIEAIHPKEVTIQRKNSAIR